MGTTLRVGDVIKLDLAGLHLQARWPPSIPGEALFDDAGDARINWNELSVTSQRLGVHRATRHDTRPGGWKRDVEVLFEPYLDDQSARDAEWRVTGITVQPEYDDGPGGNGSWCGRAVIGERTTVHCASGARRLSFTPDHGQYAYVAPERITVVRRELGSERCEPATIEDRPL